MLLDSRTWHSTGVNTTDTTRPLILQAFCRDYLQAMENYPLSTDEETRATFSDRHLALLGFPVAQPRPGGAKQSYAAYKFPGSDVGRRRAHADEALGAEGKFGW